MTAQTHPGPRTVQPPKSWTRPGQHFIEAIGDPWYRVLLTAQDVIMRTTGSFWRSREVRSLLLPVTTTAVSSPMGLGSDSLPVEVSLGGDRTYLADSMQFMLEYACRFTAGGCYYVMPSFRGEATDSTHMSEFFHSEAELPVDFDAMIQIAAGYFRALSLALLNECESDIAAVAGTTDHLVSVAERPDIERMTFDDAEEMLSRLGRAVDRHHKYGFRTISRAGERALIDHVGGGLWLTHWDPMAVPFYQALDETGMRTLNADLLIGQGEVMGMGQRHTHGTDVLAALERHGVAVEQYRWYVEMKETSPMLTSGFGLGIERLLLWAFNHDDVRDLQLLPRMRGSGIVP